MQDASPQDNCRRHKKRTPKGPFLYATFLDAGCLGSGNVLDRQLDTTAVVHVQYQYFNFLAFFEDVGHFLDASIAQHGDVNQTVLARQDVDEGTEVNDALDLTDVDLADFSFCSDAQNALTSSFSGVFGLTEDLDRAVVFDIDRSLGFFADGTNGRAAFTDDVTDLVGVDLHGDHGRSIFRQLATRLTDDLVHLTEDVQARFQGLTQASAGRLHILDEMSKAMDAPRAELGEHAPKIETIKIPVDKIREVIGSGGKVIREIVEKTGAKIDIGDDGTIKVAANDQEKFDAAKNWINSIAAEPEMGAIYTGKVVKVVDFGAFVNFFGAKDGLVHVSQIALERVANPADVLSEGQEVKVKFLGFDDRGKTKLSMKVVDQATGEDITDKINAERAERGEAPLSEDTGGRPKREGGDRGRRRRD